MNSQDFAVLCRVEAGGKKSLTEMSHRWCEEYKRCWGMEGRGNKSTKGIPRVQQLKSL